jgi:regulator of replication initiation timing
VSDASIRLQGKVIEHVFESPGEIFSSIKNFYVNETLKQVYKIIGSIDFVGNPTTIISSFMSGVRDLVVAPATAIMKSPTDVNQVGIEVAKGTISFFSHSTSGIFGFLAKMSASAGQTVAILSLDSEYRQWHRDTVVSEATDLNRVWKRRGMQKTSEIVFRPVGDILLGVAMGASGLIISPYKGFKKGGTLGLMRGVATGTAGVVAKPLVGVLDAFTHFSATVHDVARSANVLERRYQPALKLRLQYSFGPMKVLSPFDAVTARAIDLLKAFPPKAKRSKSQGGRSAEFQIHSEVLHMEHGVETYAIVSTIRVVLIKLKRNNNGLSASLGWEVSLAGDALVKSLLTDHGHNGVALTIRKRAEAKDSPIQEKSRQGQRGSRQGPIRKMNSSSGFSVDSQLSQEASSDNGDSPQQEDSNYRYGSTRKGGEILEWFTVLAEFQHRVQLTKLHNAICCVVRDFDSVVVDHAGDADQPYKGATTFGLYTFGASSQDSNTSPSSNADLIAALEHLPWMHDATFNMIRHLPENNQVAEVSKLRQGWMFSKELEASRQLGGPKWLVEARARAMFVPSEPPVTPAYLDPYDPLVEKVYVELEQGNISSAQASKLFESHSGAVSAQYDYDDLAGDDGEVFNGDGDGVSGTPKIVEFGSAGNNLQSQQMGSDEVAERRNSDESFYSAEVENPLLPVEVEAARESGKTVKAVASFESDSLFATSLVDRGESIEPSGVPAASRSGKGNYDSTTFSEMSKIDRMESLMEQLIQLNAHQATRQAIPSEMFSETHSPNHESRMADSVIHELSELRSQVQVRAHEDDELRKEIALLRQQLAEKNQKKGSNKKSKKMPHILGFGKIRKDQGSESDRNVESDSKLSAGEVNVRGTDPTFTEGRIFQLSSPSKNYVKNFSDPVARRRRSNSNDGSVDSVPLTAEEYAISRRSSRDSTPNRVRIEGYAARGRSLSTTGSLDFSVDRSVNNAMQQVRNRRSSGLSAETSLDSMAGEGLNDEFTTPGEDTIGEKQSKNEGTTFSKMFQFDKNNRTSAPAITDQDKSRKEQTLPATAAESSRDRDKKNRY